MASETTHRISVDSILFNVRTGGPPTGRLVVLSHALMADLHMWDTLIAPLHRAGYRTLRYDHVGHGGSAAPAPTRRFHFDDFTAHLAALVRQTPGGSVDGAVHALVGCSMGGVLAVRYDLLHPGRAACVVSCDAPGMDALDASKPKWAARMAEFRAQGSAELGPATVDRWFPAPVDEAVKVVAREMVARCSVDGYCACATAIQEYRYRDELGKVGARTMVLVGENDEAVGPKEVLEDVAARIPGAEYVAMKDTGHLPPMHQPEEFTRIVLEFIGRA